MSSSVYLIQSCPLWSSAPSEPYSKWARGSSLSLNTEKIPTDILGSPQSNQQGGFVIAIRNNGRTSLSNVKITLVAWQKYSPVDNDFTDDVINDDLFEIDPLPQ